MATTYCLSRLEFLNSKLTTEAPTIVIAEISAAHGICIDSNINNEVVISLIQQTPIKNVVEPISKEDWRYIARYINPNVKWTIDKLRDAFTFLYTFRSLDLSLLTPDFTYGLQTPENPKHINATLLYAFCQKYNLKTWVSMSYEHLAFAVRSLISPTGHILSYIYNQFMAGDKNHVINTCLYFLHGGNTNPCLPPPHHVSYQSLERCYTQICSTENLKDRILFREGSEVVGYVATRYLLDISSSKYPFEEYNRLRQVGLDQYIPVDPTMAKYYTVNPWLFYLDHHFNPLFPEKYYEKRILEAIIDLSGYPRLNIRNVNTLYTFVSEIYLYNTFYHGFRPEIKNIESPFHLDELQDVDSNNILCYGTNVDGFTFFTYSELAEFFRQNKAFLHPLDKGKMLGKELISRLRILCMEDEYPEEKESCKKERKKLLQSIAYVESYNQNLETEINTFLRSYEQTTSEFQGKIQIAMQKLLHLGMYMRGWEGKSIYFPNLPYDEIGYVEDQPFPIQKAPYKPEGEVYIRVTYALQDWKEYIKTLGEDWCNQINNLPMVQYEGEFVPCNDEMIGLSIGEKIAIIEKGEKYNNVPASCIRISSGWLICSAYRYMSLLGLLPPFNIQKLVYVT